MHIPFVGHGPLGTLLAASITGALILGSISAISGDPGAGKVISEASFHVLGNGTGSLKAGLPEFGVGMREAEYAGQDNKVSNYPKPKTKKPKAKTSQSSNN